MRFRLLLSLALSACTDALARHDRRAGIHVGRLRPFDPPLEISAGDTVQVELGYDLARAIVSGEPATSPCSFAVAGDSRCFRACVDTSDTTRACMDFPEFAPTATKL